MPSTAEADSRQSSVHMVVKVLVKVVMPPTVADTTSLEAPGSFHHISIHMAVIQSRLARLAPTYT